LPELIEKELKKPKSKSEFIQRLKEESPENSKKFLTNVRKITEKLP
jgi:hypothetical protein